MTEQDCNCRVCRKEIGFCALDGSPLWCEECCEDHDYEHDPDRRSAFCKHCDQAAPDDWYYCDDDVSISFASTREPGQPLGTPISELSGRPVPEGHPDRPKYDEFVRIAKSWGYD
ncbi:hypothetical protein MOV76_32115 [Rhizobium sp. PRIMUS64]|uniref:hypothetical protein n=1 Tax=Rhizobium sp. PRIMUS64 TaxID=2908925 RepID=UPI001FF3C71D|nr:hypothetical protein [Rhizobium sp. PRIMUS64]MCJ9696218.1 hypothetical protein [Rhizobium sp. PRIMUS64]